ncbi:MAG TPA: response regulator [Proteobacteria bacterium]|nr:response regulator MprA [bacterium BMS3Abin14]HDL53146.1 response regulator [Pseudomonadota bacterium]
MVPATVKILVVDDDDNIRHLLRLAFEDEFEVREARDGQEAYEIAGQWNPDMVVSDIMMPKLDGYSLYRKLKSLPETSSIPFIFLSAKKDVDEKVVGLEMGADDYITKPFSIKELKAKVRSIIKKVSELHVRGSLEGLLSEIDLVEIIQLIDMGQKTGTLILDNMENTGRIYFEKGEALFAQTGQWTGPDALFSLLSWKEGKFRLDPAVAGVEPNMDRGRGQEMLMEGVRLLDEMEEAIRQLPPAGTVLIPRPDVEFPSDDTQKICNAFTGGATVAGARTKAPFPDHRFYPLVANAVVAGCLKIKEPTIQENEINLLRRIKAAVQDF